MQVKAIIKGTVQGVGFRPFVYGLASQFKLNGYVKNTSNGVELVLDGDKKNINQFFVYLKEKHPPLVKLDDVSVSEKELGTFNNFKIFESSAQSEPMVSIPPDVGVCSDCLRELRDKKDRRHDYWFITCTNCGPRFTITEKLPYDRVATSMSSFEMCKECTKEYKNPLNRRYHAQTVACHTCGPELTLFDNERNRIQVDNPIEKTAGLLNQGNIIAIKGIGGMHLACLTSDEQVIKKLRARRKRQEKPFAIMARDLNAVKSFAEVSLAEETLLESWQKPIVLLRKSAGYQLAEELSPSLHNIGVMLPYTALYYLLFEYIHEPLVMTSANLPNEPTIKDEETAFDGLTEIADYFLMHNRNVCHRCDDSVVRVVNDEPVLLRRSRGYVPKPIGFKGFDGTILALGAELDNSFCVCKNDKAYLSQYIGNTSNYDTFCDLKKNLTGFQKLLGVSSFDSIACDLHPRFNTTLLAKELAEKHECKLVQVQHHFAHLASCMAEHGLEDAVGMVCDGYGYGLNGKAWGGEVIVARQGEFKRIGHLEYQPLLGGDLATKQPLRLAVGVLAKFMDEREIAKVVGSRVPEETLAVWFKQLNDGFNVVESSSCGRFLDAVSALLGVCEKRTYEGEPAVKLESLALSGKKIIDLPVNVLKKNGVYVLDTHSIFGALTQETKSSPEDLALSVHHALVSGMATIAKKSKIENVCFTGGVACNSLFNKFLKEEFPDLLVQSKAPCGDGGISLGQAYFSKF
ncbi:carbamoyltransferase HypF [archaeon]|nr:carbamoyltransferase HypF [archaeon]